MLVDAAMSDLGGRYGGSGDGTPIEPIEFDPPAGAFLIAYVDGTPVACGAWRTLGYLTASGDPEDVAEIKRMYTAPAVRELGVASAILRALEENARQAGMQRAVLE